MPSSKTSIAPSAAPLFGHSKEQFQQLVEDAMGFATSLGATDSAAEVSEGVGLSVSVRKGRVENVERNMAQHHLSPKEATIRSMGEIGSSLVAVVLVMAAVFVPAAFLPGTTGQLYKQFAITIDDPEEPAALLQALVARAAARV